MLFPTPAEHEANPPATWQMIPQREPITYRATSWEIQTKGGAILATTKLKRDAAKLLTEGSLVQQYDHETIEWIDSPEVTERMQPDVMTHTEFIARGTELFGSYVRDWAFQCPSCGDVATGSEFVGAIFNSSDEYRLSSDGDERARELARNRLSQECIGRSLGALRVQSADWEGRGCDWTAYGLFRGPVTVTNVPAGDDAPPTTRYCFRFAEPNREKTS